jgi:calcineurin-like phosphoesterase family protein
MANNWFISDTHWGHGQIIRYCHRRPFGDEFFSHLDSCEQCRLQAFNPCEVGKALLRSAAGDMDAAMIKNWNDVVASHDTVYHVGDVAFGEGVTPAYVSDILVQLKGHIHLIEGNHEELAKKCSARFDSIKQYDEIKIGRQRIVLFHYGLRTWHHDMRGVWHLYGHSHGGLKPYGKSCDIGVDCWQFRPVEFEELKKYMDARPIGDHPQFANYTPKPETSDVL